MTKEEITKAVDNLKKIRKQFNKYEFTHSIDLAIDVLKEQERPTGEWIVVEKMLNIWACSNCKEEYCSETGGTPSQWDYNYCPNCGARMEAENDSSK